MDKIKIKELEVFCNHGIYPEENALGQKFLVSANMYLDTREAGLSDDLTKSIHYGKVSHFIKKYMEEHTYKMIETVAEKLSMELLLNFQNMEQIQLEIKKPWAPVGLHLDTVSVEIERGWHTAYIALGSNMGDKKKYLEGAVQALDHIYGCKVQKVSDFIITEPYGLTEQDEYLNGALELRTLLMPQELLKQLNKIETSAGRERVIHWGPRTLDLDILLFDQLIMDTEHLTIPHIDMINRGFVLKPLSQIAGYVRHPYENKTINQLYSRLCDK